MKRALIFLSFFVLFSPASGSRAETLIIDSDSARIFEEMAPYFFTPGQKERLPTTGDLPDDAVIFKIIQVQNREGNNPFNPLNPVFNFGGILLANVDQLLACIRGGVCGTGSSGSSGGGSSQTCSPGSGQSNKAALEDSVGCYMIGGTCKVLKLGYGGSTLATELFAVYYNAAATKFVMDVAVLSKYTMKSPADGKVQYVITPPGSYTIEVQHDDTGVRYRVVFNVTKTGPANQDVIVTVTSFTTM